jgi:hypothetical protein
LARNFIGFGVLQSSHPFLTLPNAGVPELVPAVIILPTVTFSNSRLGVFEIKCSFKHQKLMHFKANQLKMWLFAIKIISCTRLVCLPFGFGFENKNLPAKIICP